jgi:hypothetical protein
MKLQCNVHIYLSKNLCILFSLTFFFIRKFHFFHKMNKIFGDVDCVSHTFMNDLFQRQLEEMLNVFCFTKTILKNLLPIDFFNISMKCDEVWWGDPSPHYKTNLDSWPQNPHPWNRSFHQHRVKTLLLLHVVLVLIILQSTNHANLVIPCEQCHFQTLLLLHVVLNLIILQPPNFVDLVLPFEQCHFAMLSLSQWVCKDVFDSIQTSPIAHSCMLDICGAPFWGVMHNFVLLHSPPLLLLERNGID